jgi:hypothetical protein
MESQFGDSFNSQTEMQTNEDSNQSEDFLHSMSPSNPSMNQSEDSLFMVSQPSQSTSQSDDSLQSNSQSGTPLFSSKEDSDSGEEETETYYFESDHAALQGNHDYQMMLRAIAALEAQRIQVFSCKSVHKTVSFV